jgi:hypothetical protein
MSDNPEREHPTPDAPPDDERSEPIERVHLRGPVDLVSALPHLIGFQPGDGDVIAVFTHQRRHVCTAVTQITDVRRLAEAWDQGVAAMATADVDVDVDGAFLIAYLGPDARPALRDLPQHPSVPLIDVLHVHSGRVWSLMCHRPGLCCPPDGTPIPTETPELAVPFAALTGTGNVPDRDGLGDCLQPGPAHLLAQTRTHLQGLATPGSGHDGRQSRTPSEWLALVGHEHDVRTERPAPLDGRQAALLLFALQNTEVRDACLLWYDDAAWWLWLELIRYAPPGWIAPVATLIASTAFQQGRTTQARIAAEHALADDPGYSMAGTLLGVINLAIPASAFTEQLTKAATSGLLLTTPPASPPRNPQHDSETTSTTQDPTDHPVE